MTFTWPLFCLELIFLSQFFHFVWVKSFSFQMDCSGTRNEKIPLSSVHDSEFFFIQYVKCMFRVVSMVFNTFFNWISSKWTCSQWNCSEKMSEENGLDSSNRFILINVKWKFSILQQQRILSEAIAIWMKFRAKPKAQSRSPMNLIF